MFILLSLLTDSIHESQVSIKRVQNEVTVKISSESEVLQNIQNLKRDFASLVTQIRILLAESTSTKEIKSICIYVEEYLGICSLSNIASADHLFSKIKPHYSFLNCDLIHEIAGIFLPAKCDVQIKLRNYMQKLNTFEKSSSLQHIINIIEETIEPTHDSTDAVCEVILKLDRRWGSVMLASFKKVIYYIFDDNSRVLSHIRIEKGSIYIKYSAPISQLESLIKKASSKTNFMHQIGIIEMSIGDQCVLKLFDEKFDIEKNFFNAAESGSLMQLQLEQLLQLNVNIDFRNEDGTTALMVASNDGHHQVVELLLKEGADVNIQNNNGVTCLMVASNNGHHQVVELLLKEGADVNIQNNDGWTALMIASQNGHHQVVELLLKEGADVNIQNNNGVTCLMVASANGHHQVVELLLKEGDNVNIQDKDGWTALMVASDEGHHQVVELLLKEGADVNIQNNDGWTALMAASQNGHHQVVELLLKEGADVNIQNNDGVTCLMAASNNGHHQVVELLLKEGADVNIQNNDGVTCLMAASNNGHHQVVELLLKEGADVNIQNNDGVTCLMVPSNNGHHQVVELLLKEGADVNIQDNNGWTALMGASQNGHHRVVELLLKKSTDTEIQTHKDGATALMLASEKGHTQVIEFLLKHNADANVQDKKGRTALVVARKKGHQRIVELLDPVTKQTQLVTTTDTALTTLPVTTTNDAINTDTFSPVVTAAYDTVSSSTPTSTTLYDKTSTTDTSYETIGHYSLSSIKDRLVQAVKHPFSSFDNKSKKNINIENKEQTHSIYQQVSVNSRGTQRPSFIKRMFRRQQNVTLVQYKTQVDSCEL